MPAETTFASAAPDVAIAVLVKFV